MEVIVELQDVVDEFAYLSDEHTAYLNKRTGEIVTLSFEELAAAEDDLPVEDFPEWQRSLIRTAIEVVESTDYLQLPSKFDVHAYAIMKRFCYAVEDEDLSEQLLYEIRGSGAFRRFKSAIHEHDIANDWYAYLNQALEEIAVDWLEKNGIRYKRSDQGAANHKA